MTDDASRHFDAPRSESALASASAFFRRHWRVVSALVVVASLTEMAAIGLTYLDLVGARAVDTAIGSLSILVTADSQASQVEVDALGPLIRATPGIAEANFRSKDDAIKSLVAKGLPPPDGRNPLPDVWVARLNPSMVSDRPVVAYVADIRRGLGGLPRVESASTDEAWVRSADAIATSWRTGRPIAEVAAFVLLSLGLGCAAFLSAGHLATDRISMRALAITGVIAAGASFATGYAIDRLLLGLLNVAPITAPQVAFGQILAERSLALVGILAFSMAILALGLVLGRRSSG